MIIEKLLGKVAAWLAATVALITLSETAHAQYACGSTFNVEHACSDDDWERDCFANVFRADARPSPHRVKPASELNGHGYTAYRLDMLGAKADLTVFVADDAGHLAADTTWTPREVAEAWGKTYAQLPDFVHHLMPNGVAIGAVQNFDNSPTDEQRTLGRYCDNRVAMCNNPPWELQEVYAPHTIYLASSLLIDGWCSIGTAQYNSGRAAVREELLLHEIGHLFGAAHGWDADWSDHGKYVTWAAEWHAKWGDPREHYAESFMAWAIYYYPPNRTWGRAYSDNAARRRHIAQTANLRFFNQKLRKQAITVDIPNQRAPSAK